MEASRSRMAKWEADAADRRDRDEPLDMAAVLGLNGYGTLADLAGAPGGGGTEFLFAWGGEAGGEAGAQAARSGRWRLWGQGDLQTFVGDPAPERGYEGELRTGWAGLDRTLGERWLAGVSVAKSRGGGDWRAGMASGRLKTSLTAVHPYLRWSDGATSVWTMAGGGRGSAKNARATGRVGESDLDMQLGLVEVRRRFVGWFGLRAGAAWARLRTREGGARNRSGRRDRRRPERGSQPAAAGHRTGTFDAPRCPRARAVRRSERAARWGRGPDGLGDRSGRWVPGGGRSRPD